MTTRPGEGKARGLLVLLVLLGLGLLAIPFFLTPPAFLEIAPTDKVFKADLAGKNVRVIEEESGEALSTAIERGDGGFLARIGRINSGPGSFTVEVEGYQPAVATIEASPLQTVRAAVDLVPTFGRLEISVVNATRTQEPVLATLKKGAAAVDSQPKSVFFLDLPPGSHGLSAEAAGFCPGEREVRVAERQLTKVILPLSPDLSGDEIARFVLDWGENPRDLDAHFLKAGASGSSPAHVYFHQKEGRTESGETFAFLDVDHVNSDGYETITVFNKAEGEYQYYVHLYAGDGTLGGSGARVEAFTRGCQRRSYAVPASCAEKIWTVAGLRIHQGQAEFVDEQGCESKVPFKARAK